MLVSEPIGRRPDPQLKICCTAGDSGAKFIGFITTVRLADRVRRWEQWRKTVRRQADSAVKVVVPTSIAE